jgi:L-iditol 2-dehydrogenase
MKKARLAALRRIEMIDAPRPEIRADDDVLLKVEIVGVCGSDVHYYTTGRIGCQVVSFPFAVGHEMAAVVETVGAGVKGLAPGDRVAVDPAMPCGDCDQCRAGRAHTCRELKFLGCPGQAEGCLAEYIVMPAGSCFPIPAAMSLETAALCEPLSIGVYAVRQSVPMQGARVGILGAGPIGLSVLLACGIEKPGAVYVTDKLDPRCAAAAAHGAAWAGNPDRENIVEAIAAREPALLDVVFECCGQQEALDQAIELVKPGGRIMIIGIPQFDRYSFEADVCRRKEVGFQHVRRQNECVQPTIDAVASGAMDPGFMVTHRFGLDETAKAFDLVDNYADGVIKAIIQVG